MASNRKTANYPIGSVISGTMRPEDLIPAFLSELAYRLKHGPSVNRETRKAHYALLNNRGTDPKYWESEDVQDDLGALFNALDEYSGPYFYFGAHPGDGADYGWWLSEDWDQDFGTVGDLPASQFDSIKVNDLNEVPAKFRGEVAVVSDHGNVTLYVKTSRKLHEIWSIV